nr:MULTISPECIES: hypothetical protein [Bacillales]
MIRAGDLTIRAITPNDTTHLVKWESLLTGIAVLALSSLQPSSTISKRKNEHKK